LGRNTPEQQKVHESWEQVYQDKYAHTGLLLANYYTRQAYYKELAQTILENKVPERSRFLRMLDNKYAKKVISEHEKKAKYSTGDLVTGRASFDGYAADFGSSRKDLGPSYAVRKATTNNFNTRGGIIIRIDDKIFSAAKGAKRYQVLAVGSPIPFFVEERHIKIKRNWEAFTTYGMYEPEAAFKVGDLIVGAYDFMEYLYYKALYPEDVPDPPTYVGVVTHVDYQPHYFGEYIYAVLCTDGSTRFFLEDEIAKL